MLDKTTVVSATSYWRDSIEEAKSECSRLLDSKVDDEISSEEHDGWYLISSTYDSYGIEEDESSSLYRSTRSKTLTFKKYDEDLIQIDMRGAIDRKDSDAYLRLSKIPGFDQSYLDKLSSSFFVGSETNQDLNQDFLDPLLAKVRNIVPQTATFYKLVIPSTTSPTPPIRAQFEAPLESVTFEGLRIISSKLLLSTDSELVGLPLSESTTTIPVSNCGSGTSLSIHNKVAYKYVTGRRVSIQKTTKTKYEVSGKLEFMEVGGLSASASQEVTLQETNDYTSSTEETKEWSLDISIEPKTKVLIKLNTQLFESRRSFSGQATIGGTIVASYPGGEIVNRYDLVGLLPSPADRTFDLNGYYSNLDTRILPIEIIPEGCPNLPPIQD